MGWTTEAPQKEARPDSEVGTELAGLGVSDKGASSSPLGWTTEAPQKEARSESEVVPDLARHGVTASGASSNPVGWKTEATQKEARSESEVGPELAGQGVSGKGAVSSLVLEEELAAEELHKEDGFTVVKLKNKKHKRQAAAEELKAKESAEKKLKAEKFAAMQLENKSLVELLKCLQQRNAELQSLRCGDTAGRAAIMQRWEQQCRGW